MYDTGLLEQVLRGLWSVDNESSTVEVTSLSETLLQEQPEDKPIGVKPIAGIPFDVSNLTSPKTELDFDNG